MIIVEYVVLPKYGTNTFNVRPQTRKVLKKHSIRFRTQTIRNNDRFYQKKMYVSQHMGKRGCKV